MNIFEKKLNIASGWNNTASELPTSGGSDGNMTIEVLLHSSRNMHAREMFISVFAQSSHFSLLLYSHLWFSFLYIYFVF